MILDLRKTMKDRVFIKDGQIVKHINDEHYKLVVEFKKKQEQELEAYLQYADGPAYYQDKQKIADNERELDLVEKYLAENF